MGYKAPGKTNYDLYVKPNLGAISQWYRDGATDKMVMEHLGVSEQSFYNYKREHKEFADAVFQSRTIADSMVENALYRRALGYTKTIQEQKINKADTVVTLEKQVHYPADVGAIAFWLKNRKPTSWKDKLPVAADDEDALKDTVDALMASARAVAKGVKKEQINEEGG
jgi:hypothetical protein